MLNSRRTILFTFLIARFPAFHLWKLNARLQPHLGNESTQNLMALRGIRFGFLKLRAVRVQPLEKHFEALVKQRLQVLTEPAGKPWRNPARTDGDPQRASDHECRQCKG